MFEIDRNVFTKFHELSCMNKNTRHAQKFNYSLHN